MTITGVKDQRAMYAIAVLHAVISFCFGNWSACIPWVEKNRGIDDGQFGTFLATSIFGALAAFPLDPMLREAYGSSVALTVGILGLSFGFTVLCVDSSDAIFVVGMIMIGFASVLSYASALAQAAILEQRVDSQWMGTFSGIGGVGGLIGALVGGWMLDYVAVAVWLEMLLCTAAVVVATMACFPFLYSMAEEEQSVEGHDNTREEASLLAMLCSWYTESDLALKDQETAPILGGSVKYARDWSSIWALLLIASISIIVENSIGDWSSIYLIDHWDCGYLVGILGYAAQKVATIVSGLQCDYAVKRMSRYHVFQLSIFLLVVGFAMTVVAAWMPPTTFSLTFAILGFTVAGYGLGWTLPLWASVCGAGIRGFTVSETSAIVVTVSYAVSFVSPLLFGDLAALTGDIAYSFLAEAVVSVAMALAAYSMPRFYFEHYDAHSRLLS